MKDIYGVEVGTEIDFRSAGVLEAQFPWPAGTAVSAGLGVVFRRQPGPDEAARYTTLFMEAYPPGASFIRGEGETPAECEEKCWAQYQRALHCIDGSGQHEWEPRGYRNGAGFCAKCDTFHAKTFTGEQLGQHCRECGIGTTYSWKTDPETGNTTFICEVHWRRGWEEESA